MCRIAWFTWKPPLPHDSPNSPLEISKHSARNLLFALFLIALAFALVCERYQPPSPEPADAPAVDFSAARARQFLQELVGDGTPHAIGSPANEQVRAHILSDLLKSGYAPEVQRDVVCTSFGACGDVKNVVARLEGREPGPAVLLAAHYDSVSAGPGASDDGAGAAAVLEIARALKEAPPPRHTVILLIDDGEEAGLLGARAFVEGHPWAKEIGAAVNLEARGTSGPSLMFETGSANAWLMQVFSRAVKHPITSSVFYTAYKRLPNDTDFTVFKAASYQGFNFAYIGNASQYHTPLDNFANADPGSLQHHGDNALAAVRALANENLDHLPEGEAAFFDVLALWIVSWPMSWTVWIAALAFALVVIAAARLILLGDLRVSELFWGLLAWLLMIAVSAIAGYGLSRALDASGAFPSNWVAHPFPALAAFWAIGISSAGIFAVSFRKHAGFWGLWAGVWIWWAMISFLCSWFLPGVSYVVLVPSFAAGLCALPLFMGREIVAGKRGLATIIPVVIGALIGFSVMFFLYDALGRPLLFAFAVLAALIASPLAPLLADLSGRGRWAFPGLAIVLAVLSACAAFAMPPYSRSVQQAMNIIYLQDADSGKSQWIVYPNSGRLPDSFRQHANFGLNPVKIFPWLSEKGFSADAPRLDLPVPELKMKWFAEYGRNRVYGAVMFSHRGAPKEYLLFAPSEPVEEVKIDGKPVPPLSDMILPYANGWHIYDLVDLPPEGVEIDFAIRGTSPPQIYVLDKSYGLPPEGAFLLKDRPADATAIHDGDGTIVMRRVQLP
jgi:Zn-dependent M28 family amino/carboxypeptidase